MVHRVLYLTYSYTYIARYRKGKLLKDRHINELTYMPIVGRVRCIWPSFCPVSVTSRTVSMIAIAGKEEEEVDLDT